MRKVSEEKREGRREREREREKEHREREEGVPTRQRHMGRLPVSHALRRWKAAEYPLPTVSLMMSHFLKVCMDSMRAVGGGREEVIM